MKMIFATATLLSIIATPILAQSFDPDEGTGNLDLNWQGGNALAQSPASARAEAVECITRSIDRATNRRGP